MMGATEEIKKTNHPDRIWATVNGMSTRLPDGARQLVGGWSQDADRTGAVEYVLAATLESLQRENEELRNALKKANDRACGGTFVAGQSFDMIEQRVKFLEKDIRDIARTALASIGGEHHAE